MVGEGIWVRTDEVEDVAASVRQAVRGWAATTEDPQAWKWVMLALHSAIQGACVCHLLTTAHPVGALTPRSTEEWMTYLEASREDETLSAPKRTELMGMPDLLKAVRKKDSAGGGAAPSIAISDGEFSWLRKFHDEIRNQLVHFEPIGWSIEVSGMPGLAKLAARIVADVQDAGWGFRHKNLAWQTALRAELEKLAAIG